MGHNVLPEFKIEGSTLVQYNYYRWKVEVPQGVEIIGDRVFVDNWEDMETVILPQGLVSIGKEAFLDCSNLRHINIPDTVTTIEEEAFSGCLRLETLTLPDSVSTIGPDAFLGCSDLTDLVIPESVRFLGRGAFAGCSGLQRVTIPPGIGVIPEYGFQNCDHLPAVTIPEGITAIGEKAFSGCGNLTSVTLPKSLRSIGKGAFSGCASLTTLWITEGTALPDPIGDLFWETGLEILYAPGQSLDRLGNYKTQAALGYMDLTAQGETFSPALEEEYEAYIRNNPVEFYFTDVLADLPLRYLMEHRFIPRKDAVLLLEMLELEDKFDLKASLLDYLGACPPGEGTEPEFHL